MAAGFFLIGLVLGMLGMLRKAQVSVSLWLLPTSWPFSQADRRKDRGFRPKIWSEALKTQMGVNEASCRGHKMAEGSLEVECGASDQAPVHNKVRQHVCGHACVCIVWDA